MENASQARVRKPTYFESNHNKETKMSSKEVVIDIENIGKCYRIGVKDNIPDSFAGALFGFIKSPLENYRKYRRLYKFDDIQPGVEGCQSNSSDVIWALRNITFQVKRGEVCGIIGRNGAGKSTLLKILSKITDPTHGYCEIRGRLSSLLEVGTGFHPELTGRENIYLNGTILGMRKKEVARKFDEIVDFSGIERFIDTPVKRYSSGMSVRLAFSVAAHLEPEILVIDEVLAVGDADFQKKCLNKMQEVGQQGRTVLFVSHNMAAVTRLCNRVILLSEGKVEADGPADQIVSRYLTSGCGSSGSCEFPDPARAPGGDVARVCSVRVFNNEDRVTDFVDIRHPFSVEMEYEVIQPDRILTSHFGFLNERGDLIFVTIDLDPAWRGRPRPAGRYTSRVHIPGNLLSEGMLYVNSHVVTEAPFTVQFSLRPSVAFQVIDSIDGDSARGDYGRSYPGIIRPLLKWSTKYHSN